MSLIENEDATQPEVKTDAPALGDSGQNQQPEAAEDTEGYEVVFAGDTDAPEVSQNHIQAAKRIARKKQRDMEQQLERLKAGEVSDNLRVEAEIPSQPNINDYLNDDVVAEKYNYDTNIAMAAFNAAQSSWMIEAQKAQQAAQVKQSQNVNSYLKQSESTSAAVRTYYDTAEKLNIADFDEIEERVIGKLPQGWHDDIVRMFPDKAAAIMVHFDKNPSAMAKLTNNPGMAVVELTRLADGLTIKPKSKLSSAPPADTPLNGEGSSLNMDEIKKRMDKAANDGNTAEYRKYKQLLK